MALTEELVSSEANTMIPCSTVRFLWVNHTRGIMWCQSATGERCEWPLKSTVEGTVINKSHTVCSKPSLHPLYNPAIDEHFGSAPDNVLIASVNKSQSPVAILVFGDKLDGSEFTAADKESVKKVERRGRDKSRSREKTLERKTCCSACTARSSR